MPKGKQTRLDWWPLPLSTLGRALVHRESATGCEGIGEHGSYRLVVRGTTAQLRRAGLWHREFGRSQYRTVHFMSRDGCFDGDVHKKPWGDGGAELELLIYGEGFAFERLLPRRAYDDLLLLSQLNYLEMRDVIAELGMRPY